MNGTETSMILKNSFSVEVYIPMMTNGNILELMDSMRKQSQWISESKTRAANKTISMLLLIWLEDTLNHSKISRRNNRYKWPKLTNMFTYQSPTSVSGDIFFNKITIIGIRTMTAQAPTIASMIGTII